MTRYNTKEFMSNVGTKRGKFVKLTKAGKLVGFLHPKFGFPSRLRHAAFLPIEWETTRDGEKVIEIQSRTFNCSGKDCLIDKLPMFADAAIQSGASENELILDGGNNTQSWTLGQLAGKASGATAWKFDLVAKTEYVVGWISADPEEHECENPAQILVIGTGLGNAMKAVFENRQDSVGDTLGDPMQTPYGLKLVYKEKETPAKKYQAFFADEKEAPMTQAIKEIMQADEDALGLNLEKYLAPSEPGDILKALRSTWTSRNVLFEDFLEFAGLASEGGQDPEPPASEQTIDNKQPAADKGSKFCSECGAPVETGVKFCPECGNPQASAPATASAPAAKAEGTGGKQKVKCPEDQDGCGQMVIPSKFGYCPNCAKKVDVPF